MKAQVVFYSALAFLLELVATYPYAADLQRYSNQYQNNPQRPYQNLGQRPYEGVYNNPAPRFQQQELPRINQDNYFGMNQQQYLQKGPPQIQPEIVNERYTNQQSVPNQFYQNNFQQQVHQNQNQNWRGANQQVIENQPIKVGYPEIFGNERDTQFRNYNKQVVQNNRFTENIRNEVREAPNVAEEPFNFRPNPVFNENRGSVGNSVAPEQIPYQAPPQTMHSNYLPVNTIPQIQSLPEIMIEEKFAPAIPSVPPRIEFPSNNALKRVNDHYLQVETIQEPHIPIVPPPSTPIEYGAPLSASERNLARAGNPVEQTPEPALQPNLPPVVNNVEQYISNPRIQNVLSMTKHKKRYLVIHPNGTIEHVDNLITVAKQHPNYILVNAGDLVPNTSKNEAVEKAPLVPSPTNPVQENNKAPIHGNVQTPPGFQLEVITNKPATHMPEAAKLAPNNASAAFTPTPSSVPTVPTTSPILVSSPKSASVTGTAPILPVTSTPPSNLTPKPWEAGPAPISKNQTIPPAPQVQRNVPVPVAPPTRSAPPAQTTSPVPIVPTTTPTPLAQTTLLPVTTVASGQGQTNSPIPVTTPAPTESNSPVPSTSPPKNSPPHIIAPNNGVVPPQSYNNTNSAVKQPHGATESTSLPSIETTTSPSKAVTVSNDNTPHTSSANTETTQAPVPTTATNDVVQVTSTPAPVSKSTAQPDSKKTSVTVVEIEDKPENGTTNANNSSPLVVPVLYDSTDDSSANIDKFILEEASINIEPNKDEKVPDLGNSNVLAKVPQNPVVWFRTSDPNFWRKLTDKNTGVDVVYFFQVHNQPKIEHDTKTTVFPNGTILEEFTETTWEFEGAEPTVSKRTKLTNPEDQ